MSKFIEGPWGITDKTLITDKNGEAFAGVFDDDEVIPDDCAEATARLIAAAPELLSALHSAEIFMHALYRHAYGPSRNIVDDPDYQRVCEVIDKAEGRT